MRYDRTALVDALARYLWQHEAQTADVPLFVEERHTMAAAGIVAAFDVQTFRNPGIAEQLARYTPDALRTLEAS